MAEDVDGLGYFFWLTAQGIAPNCSSSFSRVASIKGNAAASAVTVRTTGNHCKHIRVRRRELEHLAKSASHNLGRLPILRRLPTHRQEEAKRRSGRRGISAASTGS